MNQNTENHNLLLVNYHYIRDPAMYAYPGIHPISKEEFTFQLHWLKEKFHFASAPEIESFIHGQSRLTTASVFLTFDDGLADHCMIAREVLDPLGIKAAFFICSRPLEEQKAVAVHKVHWLRATTPPEVFVSEFVDLLPKDMREHFHNQQTTEGALRTYIYDTEENARLKYFINFRLSTDTVDEITSRMLKARKIKEADFCRDVYLNQGQIEELFKSGHLIGLHGHSHTPFSCLDFATLCQELNSNIQCLGRIIGKKPCWVSYPYGSDWAIPKDVGSLCEKFRLKAGLTLKRGWNSGKGSPWTLNRINTNELSSMLGYQNR